MTEVRDSVRLRHSFTTVRVRVYYQIALGMPCVYPTIKLPGYAVRVPHQRQGLAFTSVKVTEVRVRVKVRFRHSFTTVRVRVHYQIALGTLCVYPTIKLPGFAVRVPHYQIAWVRCACTPLSNCLGTPCVYPTIKLPGYAVCVLHYQIACVRCACNPLSNCLGTLCV